MKRNLICIHDKLHSIWKKLHKQEQASGTLEMVLIIVIVLGVLVLFRDNIEQLIQTVFAKITAQVNSF